MQRPTKKMNRRFALRPWVCVWVCISKLAWPHSINNPCGIGYPGLCICIFMQSTVYIVSEASPLCMIHIYTAMPKHLSAKKLSKPFIKQSPVLLVPKQWVVATPTVYCNVFPVPNIPDRTTYPYTKCTPFTKLTSTVNETKPSPQPDKTTTLPPLPLPHTKPLDPAETLITAIHN